MRGLPRWEGIPREMSIHLCECGCGRPTAIAKQTIRKYGRVKGGPNRFLMGHYAKTKKRKKGYRSVWVGDHERMAHLVIAERALGKPLPSGAQVHHVDENKQNNANSNLVICQDGAYHSLLHARARIVRAGGNPSTHRICGRCGQLLEIAIFPRQPRTQLGTDSTCKPCTNTRRREAWRAARVN